jgi:transcriptional regulator with XRE-family HTH domain
VPAKPPISGSTPGVGDRIDYLMRDRRLTRTALADLAKISRQTLHRALGKDEITRSVAQRLASVLNVTEAYLLFGAERPMVSAVHEEPPPYGAANELADFVGNLDRIIRTLSTGTNAALDPKSKLAILNGIEEAARLAGQQLPSEFWDLRRAVNEGRA